MQRVIVTVEREGEARVRDLEVPAGLAAEQLAQLIAEALRWQKDTAGGVASYRIEAQPLGRAMQPEETLAEAGVWDGSWLVLHPMESKFAEGTQAFQADPVNVAPSMPVPDTLISGATPHQEGGTNTDGPDDRPSIQAQSPTVTGWRSLGLELPPAQLEQTEKKSSSFVWKQLDE